MAKTDGVFVFLGTYPDEDSARADYDVIKHLHDAGAVGSYDAAIITKDEKGKVHVDKDETSTRHGLWGGVAAGAVVGLLFPPSIIGTALVGGAAGAAAGHLWKGMSRSDVKELGDVIDEGEAALLIVAESRLSEAIEKAQLRAAKRIAKQFDIDPKEVDDAVKQAAGQLA